MKNFLLRTMCIALVTVLCVGVNAQKTPFNASETSPPVVVDVRSGDIVAKSSPLRTETEWNLPLQFNISNNVPTNGSTAIASDGQYVYVGNWVDAIIKRYTITRNQQGVYSLSPSAGVNIIIPNLPPLRALTYDGTYFYASSATNQIWKLNMTTQTILETINLPEGIQARHCTFDPTADDGKGGFWVGDWNGSPNPDDFFLVDRNGTELRKIEAAIHGLTAIYGTTFDNVTLGGPYLWAIDAMRYEDATIHQINLKTGIKTTTGLNLVDAKLTENDQSGGGMFLAKNIVDDTWSLLTLIQNVRILAWELSNCPEITNLEANQIGAQIKLTWTAPADPPAGYKVYNNTTLLATVTTTEYLVAGLAPGTHTLGVEAVYNESCNPVKITTTATLTDVLNPVKNLEGSYDDGTITLTWDAPDPVGDFGDMITYSTSEYQGGLGIGMAWDCIWANRWTPKELEGLGIVDTAYRVTKIKFVFSSWESDPIENGTYTLKVYQGADSTSAGIELLSQEIPFNKLAAEEWNEFALNTPVRIDASLELWIGIQSNVSGGNPAAFDNGPIELRKNKLFHQGVWHNLENINATAGNWCLAAYVVNEEDVPVELSHYDIYQDHVKLGQTEATTYKLTNVIGEHRFCIVAVYENDAQSEEVCVTVDPKIIGINEDVKTGFSIAPNPATNTLTVSAENDFRSVEVISFLGQTVLSQPNAGNAATLDVSKLTNGVYFVRIISDNGTSVKKFVKQ